MSTKTRPSDFTRQRPAHTDAERCANTDPERNLYAVALAVLTEKYGDRAETIGTNFGDLYEALRFYCADCEMEFDTNHGRFPTCTAKGAHRCRFDVRPL